MEDIKKLRRRIDEIDEQILRFLGALTTGRSIRDVFMFQQGGG